MRPAVLYRLIEELITSELIYRFLASFIICQVVIPRTVVWRVHEHSTEARGRASRIFCIYRRFANTGYVTVVIMMVWMMMVMITVMIDNDGWLM